MEEVEGGRNQKARRVRYVDDWIREVYMTEDE